jgi:hypothetical protein
MDDQLKKAQVMATTLLKALTTLTTLLHPWSKRFYMFLRHVHGLLVKLDEIS